MKKTKGLILLLIIGVLALAAVFVSQRLSSQQSVSPNAPESKPKAFDPSETRQKNIIVPTSTKPTNTDKVRPKCPSGYESNGKCEAGLRPITTSNCCVKR